MIFSQSICLNHIQNFAILPPRCGRSSVVERHVANVNVEGSSPFARFVSRRFRFFRSAFFIFAMHKDVSAVGSSNGRKKVKRFAERVAAGAGAGAGSETLCRKGGTSRSDNAPHASGARVGAKLACGATLSATREFAWALNSLVVQHFLRRGNLRGCSTRFVVQHFLRCGNLQRLRGGSVHTFKWPLLFRGVKLHIGEVEFARVK